MSKIIVLPCNTCYGHGEIDLQEEDGTITVVPCPDCVGGKIVTEELNPAEHALCTHATCIRVRTLMGVN